MMIISFTELDGSFGDFCDKLILFSPCIFLTVEGILQWKLLLINETHGKYSYHYLQGFIRLKWCRISAINSRCCFQILFIFTLTWGNDPSWHIFQMGWNHQLEKNSKKQLLTPVLYKPGTGARWTCPRKSGTLMQQLVQFGSWDLSGVKGVAVFET